MRKIMLFAILMTFSQISIAAPCKDGFASPLDNVKVKAGRTVIMENVTMYLRDGTAVQGDVVADKIFLQNGKVVLLNLSFVAPVNNTGMWRQFFGKEETIYSIPGTEQNRAEICKKFGFATGDADLRMGLYRKEPNVNFSAKPISDQVPFGDLICTNNPQGGE